MAVVLDEIVADHVPAVAERDHELFEAVMGVDVHDMPQDRLAADFDHRLGKHRSLFGEPGSEAARENRDFHEIPR